MSDVERSGMQSAVVGVAAEHGAFTPFGSPPGRSFMWLADVTLGLQLSPILFPSALPRSS